MRAAAVAQGLRARHSRVTLPSEDAGVDEMHHRHDDAMARLIDAGLDAGVPPPPGQRPIQTTPPNCHGATSR
jgi:hypothetical protein